MIGFWLFLNYLGLIKKIVFPNCYNITGKIGSPRERGRTTHFNTWVCRASELAGTQSPATLIGIVTAAHQRGISLLYISIFIPFKRFFIPLRRMIFRIWKSHFWSLTHYYLLLLLRYCGQTTFSWSYNDFNSTLHKIYVVLSLNSSYRGKLNGDLFVLLDFLLPSPQALWLNVN